jgi:hypothetical protein
LEDTTTTSNVRVMHKVLSINDTNYQVSESFLLLLEILEEYVQMTSAMPDHRKNIQEKLLS